MYLWWGLQHYSRGGTCKPQRVGSPPCTLFLTKMLKPRQLSYLSLFCKDQQPDFFGAKLVNLEDLQPNSNRLLHNMYISPPTPPANFPWSVNPPPQQASAKALQLYLVTGRVRCNLAMFAKPQCQTTVIHQYLQPYQLSHLSSLTNQQVFVLPL